jgi:hypothetical protein
VTLLAQPVFWHHAGIMKWEYKFVSVGTNTGIREILNDWEFRMMAESTKSLVNVFNKLGNDGWEVALNPGDGIYIFKRPKH